MSRHELYCSECGRHIGYIHHSAPNPWVECKECGENEGSDYPDGPEFDGWEERNEDER